MKLESKFYNELKRNSPQIIWTRLENSSVLGTPDLLGYNSFRHFFTLELKVTKRNKIRFSPHQISFHIRHPKNSFILVNALGPRAVKLYEGSQIMELVDSGLMLEPLCLGLGPACLMLENLGAWCFRLMLDDWVAVVPAPLIVDLINESSTIWPLPLKSRHDLVLAINYPGYTTVPARSAAATLAALLRGRTGRGAVCWDAWSIWPALHRRCLVNHMITYYNF